MRWVFVRFWVAEQQTETSGLAGEYQVWLFTKTFYFKARDWVIEVLSDATVGAAARCSAGQGGEEGAADGGTAIGLDPVACLHGSSGPLHQGRGPPVSFRRDPPQSHFEG